VNRQRTGSGRVRVRGTTRVVILMGDPVSHSLSPQMQNAAFAAEGVDYCYVPCRVGPSELRSAVRAIATLGLVGANVTIPYKERVVSYLDDVTPEATLIGAVNTIVSRKGRLVGHNTDAPGFLRAFQEDTGISIRGGRFFVVGAGGSARAIVAAVALGGARGVTIANRTLANARRLVARFRRVFPRVEWDVTGWNPRAWPSSLAFRGLIQTTPLGMSPTDPSPVPKGWLHPSLAVYDVVYHIDSGRSTALLRDARAVGAPYANGLGMLVHQGALAWSLWTGRRAPIDVMRRAVRLQP